MVMSADNWLARQEAEIDYWYEAEAEKIKERGSVFPECPGSNTGGRENKAA